MTVKQSSYGSKKEGGITHSERTSASQQVNTLLKNIKDKAGDVVRIVINNRTTIELPAHYTQAEIDARVAKYLELHKAKL